MYRQAGLELTEVGTFQPPAHGQIAQLSAVPEFHSVAPGNRTRIPRGLQGWNSIPLAFKASPFPLHYLPMASLELSSGITGVQRQSWVLSKV